MKAQVIHARAFTAFVALVALCCCADVQAAQVRAWLDRNSMRLGETVTLNVEVSDDASAARPDFSPLQQDFNLLGTQSSSTMNIINGQATSKLVWAVGLEPKRAGSFTIPALAVAGTQTQPLQLTVQPGSRSPGKAGDDVFLDVNAQPLTPYVQQEVRVTVKLFYAVNLTDGNLEDPHGDGLGVRKLGQDVTYSADVDGRGYHVLERHYALTPEKSGTLNMAPIVFRGHAPDPGDINSFFTRGHNVTAQATGITLDVRARPPGSGTDAWLPAQSLTLSADGVDANTRARVGEPLTLTLRVKAQGLGFEQLPELKLPKIDGADIYPDKETTQNRDDGEWQYGERQRKFAIVPNRPGSLTLPALSLAWWDTEHDHAASADLPALTLNVAPAIGGAPASSQNAQSVSKTTGAPTPIAARAPQRPTADTSAPAELRTWRSLTIAALGLWALTVAAWLAWWLRRRRAAPAPIAALPVNVTQADRRKAFNDACARGDARVAARELLAWARSEGSTARTLGDLAHALEDAGQRATLGEFERGLYGGTAASGSCQALAAAFRTGLVFAPAPAARSSSPLPPLYPFAVRKDSVPPTLH